MYTDANGEFFWFAVIAGAVIGAVAQAVKPGANFGTIVGGGLIGAVAGMVGAGVGSVVAGGGFFSSGMSASMGFWGGAASGSAGGFAGGFVGSTGTSWMNGANFGQGLGSGLKGGVIGGVSGGLINGISSEIRYQNRIGTFRKGLSQIGLEEMEAVPMTDEYLQKAQNAWFENVPDNLLGQSVENVPQKYIDNMNTAGAGAATVPTSSGGILTGNASIYYNPNGQAFSSAKQLFFAMSHEMVHVSQMGIFTGVSIPNYNSLMKSGLGEILEFHAYSYEASLGSTNYGGFNASSAGQLMKVFPDFFKSLNYNNFSWTQNVSFKIP
ncbi:hypothetical protein SAMN04487911_1259 [Arenibacter nanhaiticus]|uniref:Uncharacterized protein n=1 Tax=Arenibacter nanhaiticus TaxID=558155 RepID=A0A1M6KAS6_9FLAO|nr:hypothetical protein [Arenibacter nanhaiticus]SHJ56004.1 hypothetical protein SAMN04487911_1259 [Arenibacter nanhaiticus]